MKILVCISHVPDTTSKITFSEDKTSFNNTGIQFIINPYDEIALARAIELAEGGKGTVTVINIGEVSTEPTIRKALATGADDAVRVNAAPRDAWFVAKQIANYANGKQFDLILTGRESIDYNGVQVAGFLGEFLNIPSISIAKKIDIHEKTALVEREIEGGKEIISSPLPLVVGTAEGVAEPRIPNMRGIMSARTKPLEVIEAIEVETLTKIVQYESPAPRGAVTLIDAAEPEKLIELLHTKARVI
ncbi:MULTISPECIES: electron transfer flavoprotein subunit beta/FixA family protein [Olivibacter]|uniref:Electron transfer flavoprotein alpha/beta-subunit n=3 Tax=Sphingobacteriaceae TaxID=84566 RepID=F4C5E9_SPHS2|nr:MULTISPECIES: electron transfer flavoprotein subunit beta/FixA family protein [Olivibacter]MCL4641974.1 electron transfer flavoprotein subunit beta/FixA family protein [Olivibacter sp. UJ_SKK_5.1]MDX3913396.1 electron transfer flavoprotein subunit beta/FixA family protein [Pseudosphingobacterium sp.]QEL01708.1 electron transfer flavoprotein subunit beta/FixA family protein [Olivibacter sp. LS-1]